MFCELNRLVLLSCCMLCCFTVFEAVFSELALVAVSH